MKQFLSKPRSARPCTGRVRSLFADNKICFYSFLLPFLAMLAIFIGNGIYPFGDGSFMHSDMYHQYVPFLEEFLRKVKDGEPLYHSWRIGMGSNYLALYGYYSASPVSYTHLRIFGKTGKVRRRRAAADKRSDHQPRACDHAHALAFRKFLRQRHVACLYRHYHRRDAQDCDEGN